VHHRDGELPSADATVLHWQAWLPDKPRGALAVVHGLGEHGGRYGGLAEAMAPLRWSCWAVDLRGMGRSPGRRGHVDGWERWIEDAAAFHAFVHAQCHPLPVVPLGHSFGGVVVLRAVQRRALRPACFVLSNPALTTRLAVPAWKRRLGAVSTRVWPTLTMSNGLDAALISRDPAAVDAYRRDALVHDRISARLYAEWTAACAAALADAPRTGVPFLLILSGDDRIIDAGAGRHLAQVARPTPDVHFYPDRFHEPFNDLGADEVLADLAAWLARA
jgi:alpha-beta hydrolase superfamily lysophospholipase